MSDIVLHQGGDGQAPPEIQFVGAPARVDFLPPEIQLEAAVRSTRRLALLGIVGAIAIVAVAYLGVLYLGATSQQSLAAVQAQTAALQGQQASFQPVRDLQRQVRATESILRVVNDSKLDWVALLQHLYAGAPADRRITTVSFGMQSPLTGVEPAGGLFAQPRIGVIRMTVVSSDLVALTYWVDSLKVDASFSDVTTDGARTADAGWTMDLEVGLSPSLNPLPAEAAQ